MGTIQQKTVHHSRTITRLVSFQRILASIMKFFLLSVFSMVGLSLADWPIEEVEDHVKEIGYKVEEMEASMKALDDSVKDELKDLKQLVEDEFDDLKYILNIVLGKVDKVLHKPKFGYGPGPKYGHKYGGYGHGYGHKYGPPKKYGYGHGHGYGKKGW